MTIAKNIDKLASRKRKIVARAEQALKAYGKDAVPPLLVAFDSPDFVVRYRVAMILGRIGDSRALRPLMAHTQDASAEVRYDSALALGKLGDVNAVPFLIDLLVHPIDDTCTDGAAFASLIRLGEIALPSIQKTLSVTTAPEDRMTLLELEQRITDPDIEK